MGSGLNPDSGLPFIAVYYIDDVLVFCKALEEHLHHPQLVLLKLKKCHFIR